MNAHSKFPAVGLSGFYSNQMTARAMESKDPILIVPNTGDVNKMLAWDIPALCAEGQWTREHAEHLSGCELVLAFCNGGLKHRIGKALDGYAVTLLCLEAGKAFSLSEFIDGGGDSESLLDLMHRAPIYEYRDDAERARSYGTIPIAELMATTFPPIKWIVPDILPEGLTLLAGPSKLGKSWLALDIALGVSLGDTVLSGLEVEQGDVLLWALEDNARRLKSRLETISQSERWQDSRLSFRTASTLPPTLDNGGLEQLQAWCESVDNPRLIIIDVLEKVRPEKRGAESEYSGLYRGLMDIHRFAAEIGISILVVHHTNKQISHGDPFDKVSGSRAFTSLPDATLVMDRDPSGFSEAILYGRGRDLPEFEKALAFNSGLWSVMDDAETVKRSSQRNAILELLKDAPPEGLTPKDLCKTLEKPENNVSQLLFKMKGAGEVKLKGRGLYVLPPER